jgi:hypothetical protein
MADLSNFRGSTVKPCGGFLLAEHALHRTPVRKERQWLRLQPAQAGSAG